MKVRIGCSLGPTGPPGLKGGKSRVIKRIHVYVASISVLAGAAMAFAWGVREQSPQILTLVSFCFVAFLLDRSPSKLRVSAGGSTSFVVHLAAGILFGAFWGGVVTGVSIAVGLITRRVELAKTVFNTSQRVLALVLGVLLYQVVLGGHVPPSYLIAGQVSAADVQRDLFLFFLVAAIYVLTNVGLVTGAVSISSGRPYREVWHLNVRGIIGYDLGASSVSLMIAWVYWKANQLGIGEIAVIATIFPVVAIRHIYALYHNLEQSGQELLELMVKAIEARDPYTSGHSLRVRELSRAIALELGLSGRDIEEVETAALLHDVGKIHEEFAPLLRKESRLTADETALMQSHAIKSAELVGIISKFRGGIQRAVRHHHERWDGEGYPDGVKGSDIPLASRIIIIADTIDAMTTDRPYRKRLSLDIVLAELQKCRGTQFDPDIVDVTIGSVTVRRHIVGPGPEIGTASVPMRSRRVGSVAAAFLRAGRA
jgi:putative nucleotidyltransferase with HDIG domain